MSGIEVQADESSQVVFTDAASLKVRELLNEEDNPDQMLRVFVTGGGCSGFQYGFKFDPDASKKILTDAVYKMGSDWMFTQPNCDPINLNFAVPNG